MTEELEKILSNLEIEQLKEIAQKYGIDCEDCNEKEEYIIQISDSQKVTEEDVHSLFGIDAAADPSSSDGSIPSFTDAEELMQETKSIFDSGDYIATINKATEALDSGSKALNAFYLKALSYAIRSTESMVQNLKGMEIDISPIEEILDDARKSHDNQEFESTGAIISKLKDSLEDLLSTHGEKIADLIESTQSFIDKAKEIGADVEDAEKKLNDARELHAQKSLPFAFDSVKESESLVKAAMDDKKIEVQEIISRAAKVIEDARYLHAPVSEAESLLESAKGVFDLGDYTSAMKNASEALRSANAARDEQIRRALSLQERIKVGEKVSVTPVVTKPSVVSEEIAPSEIEEKAEAEEKPDLIEEGMFCPKCEGEPTYVDHYKRYYCYTCNEYIKPQALKKEEEVKEEVEEEVKEEVEEEVKEEEMEAAKVCPKCSGEPSYVEQYDRYYCYTCSEYIEPVDKKEEKPKKDEMLKEAVKVCPKCEGEPTYVEQYKRYYCYSCSDYIEPKEKKKEEKPKEKVKEEKKPTKAAKACPKCGCEPTYVEQYKKYYCYTCSTYVEPSEKEPTKVTSKNVCSTCGQDATFVDQYKRYYCYTCSKYL